MRTISLKLLLQSTQMLDQCLVLVVVFEVFLPNWGLAEGALRLCNARTLKSWNDTVPEGQREHRPLFDN
jgi:hypothetical protein